MITELQLLVLTDDKNCNASSNFNVPTPSDQGMWRINGQKMPVGACLGYEQIQKSFRGMQLIYKPLPPRNTTSQSTVSTPSTSASSPTQSATPGSWVVKSGDTGWMIANAYGIAVGDLAAANPGINWNLLPIGHTVIVPSKGTTAPTA
jgi:LysM repeat protein